MIENWVIFMTMMALAGAYYAIPAIWLLTVAKRIDNATNEDKNRDRFLNEYNAYREVIVCYGEGLEYKYFSLNAADAANRIYRAMPNDADMYVFETRLSDADIQFKYIEPEYNDEGELIKEYVVDYNNNYADIIKG